MSKNERMQNTIKVIDRLSAVSGYIAMTATFALTALILSEIFCRAVLQTSILFVGQASEWLLVCIVFMGSAWTLKTEGHVRIGIITSHFSEKAQTVLTVCLASISIVILAFFSVYAWQGLVENYVGHFTGHSVYRMPKWWAWAPYFIGIVMLLLQFVSILLEKIGALQELNGKGNSLRDIIPPLVTIFIIAGIFITGLTWAPPRGIHSGIILLTILAVVFLFIGSSLWIFLSLGLTGIFGLLVFTNYSPGQIVAQIAFSANESFVLSCLPLFVFMGELLFRSGASSDLYSGFAPWVGRIPGRLLHSNVLTCSIFAAISGSSAVTCATIGTVAVPELKKLGYDERLTLGSIAGAGTLGLLIPPSIVLIIYGAVTAQSIGQLFLAGIIPGIVLSFLFMLYIGVAATLNPSRIPPARKYSWEERAKLTVRIIPIFLVILLVLGLIYLGITTPTEAGAIGSACALVVVFAYGNLNWKVLKQSAFDTIRTTCMIMFIVTGAAILSSSVAYLRVPQALVAGLEAVALPKYLVFTITCILYLGMGCLFDGVSMMVLTLPIVFPMMMALGFDPIWFGIVLTVLIETAQITPPVGFNLYVLQTISQRPISVIVRSTIPFFLIMLLMVVILVFFPKLATMLPNLMI